MKERRDLFNGIQEVSSSILLIFTVETLKAIKG